MLTLAATAVSSTYFFITGADRLSQLYATIRKWCTETYHSINFSANRYLNVYQGHINTLTHIWECCNNAYHVMMSDIYYQAR